MNYAHLIFFVEEFQKSLWNLEKLFLITKYCSLVHELSNRWKLIDFKNLSIISKGKQFGSILHMSNFLDITLSF